jgi:hypothetical protein
VRSIAIGAYCHSSHSGRQAENFALRLEPGTTAATANGATIR